MSTALVPWRERLSKSHGEILEGITENIRGLLTKSVEALYLAGCELRKARELLGSDDSWIEWLEEEFKPGWRWTAGRLLHLAEKLKKPYERGLLVQFAPSATYELCKPSAPPEALQRAVEEAAEGKKVTHARAKELVAEQREEESLAAAEAVNQLPPEAQKTIRRAAREKALRDARAEKLGAIERHLGAARKVIEGEPEIADDCLDKLDEVLVACRKVLG